MKMSVPVVNRRRRRWLCAVRGQQFASLPPLSAGVVRSENKGR